MKIKASLTLPCLICLALSAHANPFEKVKGSWTGAVKFDSRGDEKAHSVGTLSLHVGIDGAVDAVHANGCKISGVISEATPTLFYLDVRLMNCSYGDFNRRWNGTLAFDPKQMLVTVGLAAQEVNVGKPSKFFDARGTLQK